MLLRKIALTGILLSISTQTAWSQEQGQNLTNLRNAGGFSCEEVVPVLTTSGRQLEKTAFLQWTAGYTTAAARSNSLVDIFPLADTWELVRMIALICNEAPDISYESATRTALGRLRPFWVHEQSEIIVLNDPGGRQVEMYQSVVAPLQERLSSLGFNITVDGQFGDQTGNIIRQLNEQRGSQPWLTPDGELLYLLTLP